MRVWAIVALLMLGANQVGHEQQEHPSAYHEYVEYGYPFAFPWPLIFPPHPAVKEERPKDNSESRWYEWLWIFLKKWLLLPKLLSDPTWGLFIAAVAGIGVALKTLKAIETQAVETKRAVDETSRSVSEIRRQANIMERQTELGIQKERPRITVAIGDPVFDPEGITIINYKVEFWCPTPAFITTDVIAAYIDTGGLPVILEYMPMFSENRILNTITKELSTIVFGPERPAQIMMEKLIAGTEKLRVKGIIKYRGIHSLDTEEPYHTQFSAVWTYLAIPGLASSGYWIESGENEENENT